MTHKLHNYLVQQLDSALRKHRVVVFYDFRSEFEPFLSELQVVGTGIGDLPRTCIGDTLTHMARFEGSFFALKAEIEPLVSADMPEALLIYVPGLARDRASSVLMEVERGGQIYGDAPSHALKSVARRLLRNEYTDGDIDEMLLPETLSYNDVVQFLNQSGTGGGSLIRLVLNGSTSEELITNWIVSSDKDEEITSKLAEPELYRLIYSRLGIEIEEGTSLEIARHQTVRYLLVNEFRSDLNCDAPEALKIVPAFTRKEEMKHIAEVNAAMREHHGEAYMEIADGIEKEFSLADAEIAPSDLGSIDTFRFEERRLLHLAADFVASEKYADALNVVAGRGHSLWVDHPDFLGRFSQWEGCRLMAELGSEIEIVRPAFSKMPSAANKWIESYAQPDGWYRVDRLQRALEVLISKLEDDPEEPLERALALTRRNHEELLKDMAHGFTNALVDSAWSTTGVLHQSSIYADLIEPCGGRVAYFFVDAMRYEMGVDLVEQLTGAQELQIQPAAAALPSITPIGMAALLPGSSSSFSVIEHKGQLASQIGDAVLPAIRERMKLLKAVRPDSSEILLDRLLHWTGKKVAKALGDSKLVVVRSQEIDAFGEGGHEFAARGVMDNVIGNIARAIRKLSKLGIEQFVITSDHGHQFSLRKAEDMMMDRPGGNEVDQHRRCWAGHGGQTPTAAVRVSGAELGYQTDLDFVFPRGLAVFKAGGDLAFHHGGCSLQEMVVPVITLRMPTSEGASIAATKVLIEGYPVTLTNRTFGCRLTFEGDLLDQEPVAAKVVLIGDGQEVGRAGMAPEAEFDRATATVQLPPRQEVNIGMMLTNESSKKIRIVVQDPATDAVLGQSEEIEVGELI